MASSPDSALSILEDINPETIGGARNKARYALLKSMALDKNYVDTTAFAVMQPAIDYFLKHGSADEKLRTCYYQGRIYQNQGNADSAMQCFISGSDYFEQASDTMTMANLLVAQGTIFYSNYELDDHVRVNLESAELYNEIGRHDYELLNYANVLDVANVIEDKRLADSVMALIDDRLRVCPDLNEYFAHYKLMYAVTFCDEECVKSILDGYCSVDSIDSQTKMDVAWAYCEVGDAHNAKRFFDATAPDTEVNFNLKYLAVKVKLLELSEDYEGALGACKDFYATHDSIHLHQFSHYMEQERQRHEMEKSALVKIQQREKVIWLSVCAVCLLLIIVVFIYYRYRLSRAKHLLDEKEKERLQLEQETLKRENENLELKNLQTELECERQALAAENLRLRIEQLEDERESLREILEKRHDLAKPVEEAIRIRIEMFNGLLAKYITENDSYSGPYEEWIGRLKQNKDEFMNSTRLAFKATHPKFIEYLEACGLTESEINYVCLYAIGLRGKEVGDFIQVKRHYHLSSDIRKKLGLDEHGNNLGIYIRKLMKEL